MGCGIWRWLRRCVHRMPQDDGMCHSSCPTCGWMNKKQLRIIIYRVWGTGTLVRYLSRISGTCPYDSWPQKRNNSCFYPLKWRNNSWKQPSKQQKKSWKLAMRQQRYICRRYNNPWSTDAHNMTPSRWIEATKLIFNVSYGLRLRFEGKSTFTSLPHE